MHGPENEGACILFIVAIFNCIKILEIGIHTGCQALQAVFMYMLESLLLDRLTAQQSLDTLCLPAVYWTPEQAALQSDSAKS